MTTLSLTPRHLLRFAAFAVLGLSAACISGGGGAVENGADATASYITAKREYVRSLQEAMVPGSSDSPYRLVAVTGPQWRIGEVLDAENPLNVITEKCLVPAEKLPANPIPWTTYPGYTATKRVDLSAGLPGRVLKFLGQDNGAGVSFDLTRTAVFSLSDLQATILAQDAFEASFSGECREVLTLRGGLVVRGIVSGKETFKSGQQIVAGANFMVLQDSVLRLSYNDQGDFVLEDQALTPKIFMVAFFPKQDRTSGSVTIQAPTREQLERIEGVSRR